MTRLGVALREKYKSPQAAIRALGLDESLLKESAMTTENRDLAKKINAVATRQVTVGALVAYLKPRLALDARIDMSKVFDGVTGTKFKAMKPTIAQRITEQAKPKLAKDASLDDVEKVLDMLDGHEVDGGDESVSPEQHNAMEAAAHGNSTLGIPEKVGKEFVSKDGEEGLRGFLKEKGMGEDDINAACEMMKPKATDEDPEEKRKAEEAKKAEEKKAADAKTAKDNEMKDMVTKPAMDEAIKGAVTAAVAAERANNKALHDALQKVRPIVGELNMAFDTAADVFRHVLKMKGVANVEKVHESALETIIDMQPKAGARPAEREPHLGMDAAQAKDFNDRFPGASRIGAG